MVIAPRQFGQILNDAVDGLVPVWKALFVPALLATVPTSIATIVAFVLTGGAEFLDVLLNSPDSLQALPPGVLNQLAKPFYLAVGITTFLVVMAGIFVALASHSAVVAQIKGTPLTSGEVTRMALRRYPTGLGATLVIIVIVGVLITLGAIVWLIPATSLGMPNTTSTLIALLLAGVVLGPGIWAAVAVSMTTPAVAIEGSGPLQSIRRSMQLVRRRWWPTALFLVLVGLVGGVAIQLIQFIALPLAVIEDGNALFTIVTVLGVLGQGLLVSAIAVMQTHWYIDLRARKEYLSIETLG